MKIYVDTACAKRISLPSFISELFDFGGIEKKEQMEPFFMDVITWPHS